MFFDVVGTLVSLLSTYFFIRLNSKAWLIGILATFINGWLYWRKGIYADMLLEFFYFLSMCYGWYLWKYNYPITKTAKITGINHFTSLQWSKLALGLSSIFALIYFILLNYTNSNVVFLDAATTAMSLVAQYLMCHKIIITWVLWFVTDALYAFMYLSKDLPFHCGLMLVYTGMAVTGYLIWSRRITREACLPPPIPV